jgi:hypothetical protein
MAFLAQTSSLEECLPIGQHTKSNASIVQGTYTHPAIDSMSWQFCPHDIDFIEIGGGGGGGGGNCASAVTGGGAACVVFPFQEALSEDT